ncbi:phosphohydrolase [Halopiger thermotolerans]
MPEVTISDNLYAKLEEQSDDAIEDAVWELLYKARRE